MQTACMTAVKSEKIGRATKAIPMMGTVPKHTSLMSLRESTNSAVTAMKAAESRKDEIVATFTSALSSA